MKAYVVIEEEIDYWHDGRLSYNVLGVYSSLKKICIHFDIYCFNDNNMSVRAIEGALQKNAYDNSIQYRIEEYEVNK